MSSEPLKTFPGNKGSSHAYPLVPIVVIDDEASICTLIRRTLEMAGITNVIACDDPQRAREVVRKSGAYIVILDLVMPRLRGEVLLEQLRAMTANLAAIMVTVTDDPQKIVECMRLGAVDYLVKPIESGRLVAAVRRVLENDELRSENRDLKNRVINKRLEHPDAFAHIITANERMQALFLYTESAAKTSQAVLISGETGAGKELFARAVHDASGRPGQFVAVNVAGLDSEMFSDTLFGHGRGAFTGAVAPRQGLVEAATGGTLFLDEIGDLQQAAQVKLLRLLESGEYLPLGSDHPRMSSARIVASTNRDLRLLQENGAFRRDLYFRLGTHEIGIPPLREHLDDIPLLVRHFADSLAAELGRPAPDVSPALIDWLRGHTFPGNVRELRSMIADALSHDGSGLLSPSSSRPRQAPPAGERGAPGTAAEPTFGAVLPSIRHCIDALIAESLRRTGGVQADAARLLGISAAALSRRLSRHRTPSRGGTGE